MNITIKRVYEPARSSDGLYVLVDRLWPRGLSKARAHLDHWMRGVAPSLGLRKWFSHDPAKFFDFQQAYRHELSEDEEKQRCVTKLIEWSRTQTVTLLYAAKDSECNHAIVLLHYLQDKKRSEQL
jgi:uncharacterized protein YeaO (DUF488 family)